LQYLDKQLAAPMEQLVDLPQRSK